MTDVCLRNTAQVSGGERELRSAYLPKPFNRARVESLLIMTAYSSYDGIPAIANKHLLTDIVRCISKLMCDGFR